MDINMTKVPVYNLPKFDEPKPMRRKLVPMYFYRADVVKPPKAKVVK